MNLRNYYHNKMYLIRGQNNLNLFKKRFPNIKFSATIGNFDGLHLGHKSILKSIKKDAKNRNSKTIVFFTEPHASEYFAKKNNNIGISPPRLSPWREKIRLLDAEGIDFAFFLKFNNALQTMTPEIFIEEILGSLDLVSLKVGDDFRFGANRAGDFEFLKNWGDSNNISISNTPTFLYKEERVSSTRIRDSLLENNFLLASELLGRPYTFSGKVVGGQKLGRTIGVPTANLWIPKQKLPISGVYAVQCLLDGENHMGIANMGVRPTVNGTKPVLEVHLFDFNKDIYSKRLKVEFKHKIRNEKKFKDLNLLKSQIQKDISIAKGLLK
jgi:riboflavin kinase/FMN adenylyltransferase